MPNFGIVPQKTMQIVQKHGYANINVSNFIKNSTYF